MEAAPPPLPAPLGAGGSSGRSRGPLLGFILLFFSPFSHFPTWKQQLFLPGRPEGGGTRPCPLAACRGSLKAAAGRCFPATGDRRQATATTPGHPAAVGPQPSPRRSPQPPTFCGEATEAAAARP